MELFELEPVVSEVIVEAESGRAPVLRSTNRSYKHPGRQELPANLPRAERVLPCTPGQRMCKRCGRETVVIELPGEFSVGCGTCEVFCSGHETRETGLSVV
jgi:hypothetical protein